MQHNLICETLTKNEMVEVLQLVQLCAVCQNEDDFRKILAIYDRLITFDFQICGLAQMATIEDRGSYSTINTSFPEEFLELYMARDLQKYDPVLKAIFSRFDLFYYQDVIAHYYSTTPPEMRRGDELAYEFGVKSGYGYGLKNSGDSKGSFFCFAGKNVKRDLRTEVLLNLILPHLHQALCRISPRNTFTSEPSLSNRELEILKWLKNGKSTWDISIILGISERTVKFHVNNIMHKLDASNRTHAVVIALEKRLIDLN
jgi:LuxR family transcriptional regulator, quorum-sensing system regulator CviR